MADIVWLPQQWRDATRSAPPGSRWAGPTTFLTNTVDLSWLRSSGNAVDPRVSLRSQWTDPAWLLEPTTIADLSWMPRVSFSGFEAARDVRSQWTPMPWAAAPFDLAWLPRQAGAPSSLQPTASQWVPRVDLFAAPVDLSWLQIGGPRSQHIARPEGVESQQAAMPVWAQPLSLSPIRIDRGSGPLQVTNHGTGGIQHTTSLGSGIMALTQLRQKSEDFVCGDALAVERTIAGIPTGLTLTTARLTIKAVATDLDAAAILQLTITSAVTSSGQITNTGSSGTGAVRFTLSGAQTVLLTPRREYAFDIQVNTSDGAPYTPCKGTMIGEQQITIVS